METKTNIGERLIVIDTTKSKTLHEGAAKLSRSRKNTKKNTAAEAPSYFPAVHLHHKIIEHTCSSIEPTSLLVDIR